MDIQEYNNIDGEVAEVPQERVVGVCRNADKPLNGCLPMVGDYATLYIKIDKEIPIGETKGLVKVKIERIDNGVIYGIVCDSHYDNPLPLGMKVTFRDDKIFAISDI